ncbi:hypothetical protein L484_011935 [Morus notabilis]|nr:dirigent protein 1 [Morus notabilis]XP_024033044.1 dirigent protein 1 [Morus notabilis]EXB37874.1 hypothetical protein L484_011935 [Morus notabilis]
MAQIVATKMASDRFLMATLFVLALVISSSEAATKSRFRKLKETNLVFYMHDYATGRNATVLNIAGPANHFDILKFGTMVAIDDKLTEAYDWDSPQVGRARGVYANSAVEGNDLYLSMSLVFTNREYNGSTLQIQGSDRFFIKYRELSVMSGTGKFRMARGFAILETMLLDLPTLNAILRCNVTVFHN